MTEDPCHESIRQFFIDLSAPVMHGNIQMHAASGLAPERLGGEVRVVASGGTDRADRPLHCGSIVRRRDRIAVSEIDLHLSRSPLVMGGFRGDPHLHQRVTDIPAQVLAAVQGLHVHVARLVDGPVSHPSFVISAEHVEFHFRSELDIHSGCGSGFHSVLKDLPRVAFKKRSVRITDVAEHAADSPVRRSPGHNGQSGRVGPQEQVAPYIHAETRDGAPVNGDPVAHRALQLSRHDGYVFLSSEHVKIGQPDKLHVLFFYECQQLFVGSHLFSRISRFTLFNTYLCFYASTLYV